MTTFADDLIARFEPWITDDLEEYLTALAVPFAEVEELAFDQEGEDGAEYEGWTLMLDPERAPADALVWLGQFIGERVPAGLDTEAQRAWLIDHPHQKRGTPLSIARVAQRTLTDSGFVVVVEQEPDSDTVTVHTLTSQTPDPDAVEAELRRDAVPADIVLVYSTITGQSYTTLEADTGASDYDEMQTTWPDYNAVAADMPDGGVYGP